MTAGPLPVSRVSRAPKKSLIAADAGDVGMKTTSFPVKTSGRLSRSAGEAAKQVRPLTGKPRSATNVAKRWAGYLRPKHREVGARIGSDDGIPRRSAEIHA